MPATFFVRWFDDIRLKDHRHVGICGEALANYPEIARFLAELGIDS